MKLFVSPASPYARKVRIVVREKGLLDWTDEIFTVPVDSPADLLAVNPVSQIPALVTDDGTAWTDSALICAWLDGQGTGPRLLPGGDAGWTVRRLEVAANAVLEMTVKMVLENRRPENERSPFWLKRWEDGLRRGLDRLETMCPVPDAFDLGSISVAVTATYAEFRYPHIDWRPTCPKVAALTETLEKRHSFIDTFPK